MIVDKTKVLTFLVCLGFVLELTVIGDYFRIVYSLPKSISLVLFSAVLIMYLNKFQHLGVTEVIVILYLILTESLFGLSVTVFTSKFIVIYLIFRLGLINVAKVSDFFLGLNTFGLGMLILILLFPSVIIFENDYVGYLRKADEGYGSLYFGKNFSGLLLIGDEKKSILGMEIIRYSGYFFEPSVFCFCSILFLLLSKTGNLLKKLILTIAVVWSFSIIGIISIFIYWLVEIIRFINNRYLIIILPFILVVSYPIAREIYFLVITKLSSSSGLGTLNTWLNIRPDGLGYGCSWNPTTYECQGTNTFSFVAWVVFLGINFNSQMTHMIRNKIRPKHILVFLHVLLFLAKSPLYVLFSPIIAMLLGHAKWRIEASKHGNETDPVALNN